MNLQRLSNKENAGPSHHISSSKHLWRSIRKGPKEARCCGEVGLSHDARQANIPNLSHGVILVEKNILGLQITVDHLHMDAQEVMPPVLVSD